MYQATLTPSDTSFCHILQETDLIVVKSASNQAAELCVERRPVPKCSAYAYPLEIFQP
jgi:hypothetical protein